MSEIRYLLWAHDRDAWWRPAARGYTTHLIEAGLYTEAQAIGYVVQSAQAGLLAEATCMIVARFDHPDAVTDVTDV